MFIKILLVLNIFLCFLFTKGNCDDNIRCFLTPTIALQPHITDSVFINTGKDKDEYILYRIVSKEGFPISYFRKITREVCFDNQCRLLTVNIYWNITGRYLGFELPEGEYLSKTDHKPFNEYEYKRLNMILADSLSPLNDIDYNEIVPKVNIINTSINGLSVDGITSPTSKDVLEYVVMGAAYTTYTMWHIVYGETQREIIRLTNENLSPTLISAIFRSPNLEDKYWALDRVNKNIVLSPDLRHVMLSFINKDDYSLAEKTISTISSQHLRADSLQIGLFKRFDKRNYGISKLILNKLRDAPVLNEEVKMLLTRQLRSLNGGLLINAFDLLRKHHVRDDKTLGIIVNLLESDNSFIARKAYEFLLQSRSTNVSIIRKMEHFNYLR